MSEEIREGCEPSECGKSPACAGCKSNPNNAQAETKKEPPKVRKVIGVVSGSIGERLYDAKIYLQTADLLAWTVVIVAMSAGFEWLMLRLLRRVFRTLGGDAAC